MSVVASYMEHASAFGKVSTLASEVAKGSMLANEVVKSGLIASEVSKSSLISSFYTEPLWSKLGTINIPRHDFSELTSAVARLSNQGIAFSSAYQFAPLFNHISSAINSSFVENLSEYIHDTDDDVEEIEELNEEDIQVKIKRPYFFDRALKINIIVNVTDAEVQSGNLNEEEVSTWKKILFPVLTVLGQLFLAWAMSDTPLHETNVYKSVRSIIDYVETLNIDFDDLEQPDSEAQ
ncbi:hypothetical protein GMB86_05495 [Terrilactibacillus sp. BCM23-1]|uniref:Uncharacterized protein n=1 Tax=Terrilactibacillus tamarindi TaxID=2599694 RepID=A0A6N8CQW9_9BACI|nr:hypothetical protein [Terrilactibacillus tamarindi]MTT31473.1 hypothetical protein [Terrilactibacillus tamarindi]